jgi:acetyl esterase
LVVGCKSIPPDSRGDETVGRTPSAGEQVFEACEQSPVTTGCPRPNFPACRPSPAVREALDRVYAHGIVDPPIIVPRRSKSRETVAKNIISTIPIYQVEDREIAVSQRSVRLRIYRPIEKGPRLPTILFLHGGGFIGGSVESYDSITREISRVLPAVVVSVSYHLAPERPFPAAVEDSFAALQWVKGHEEFLGNESHRLVVMGDSAGGNLAAVVARKAALAGIHLSAQVLIYPVTDTTNTPYESIKTYGQGYFLTNTGIESYRGFYLPNNKDRAAPDASPMNAPDGELKSLAPAYFLLAGCDPLSDEGLAYARKLHALGVPVTIQWEGGMTHGFLSSFNNPRDVTLGKETTPIFHHMITEVAAMIGRGG